MFVILNNQIAYNIKWHKIDDKDIYLPAHMTKNAQIKEDL